MATADDLRFGRKRSRKACPYDLHVHYQGTWAYGTRERYRDAIAKQLKQIKSLKALANWRGTEH